MSHNSTVLQKRQRYYTITRPNITRCMNNLETELGCHLFVRSNRGVSLTPEGQKLFNHVAIAFEQLELGETELKRDQSLTSGLISIGVSENALRIMLLPKLEAFHNHYPHVRLKISNHSTPQAIASLESGLVDFAVVTTPLSVQKQFQKISLGSFREILIAGRNTKNWLLTSARWKNLRNILLSRWRIIPAPEIFIFSTFLPTAFRSVRIWKLHLPISVWP